MYITLGKSISGRTGVGAIYFIGASPHVELLLTMLADADEWRSLFLIMVPPFGVTTVRAESAIEVLKRIHRLLALCTGRVGCLGFLATKKDLTVLTGISIISAIAA